jgi:hypothetical protein
LKRATANPLENLYANHSPFSSGLRRTPGIRLLAVNVFVVLLHTAPERLHRPALDAASPHTGATKPGACDMHSCGGGLPLHEGKIIQALGVVLVTRPDQP